jgi:metacaspase-1
MSIDLTSMAKVSDIISLLLCRGLTRLFTVSLVDNVKQGVHLASAAASLIRGGFSMAKVNDAKQLLAGAQSFFHGLHRHHSPTPEGLGKEHFVEGWEEGKDVWMFSGE